MNYPWLVIPLFVTTAVLLLIGAYSLRFRAVRAATPFAFAMLLGAGWAFTYAMGIFEASLPLKVFWLQVRLSLQPVLPISLVVVALEHARQTQWARKRFIAILLILPVINLLVVWTNWFFPLLHYDVSLPQNLPVPILQSNGGLWWLIVMIHSYTISTFTLGIFFYTLQSSQGIYFRQTVFLALASLFPAVSQILFVLGIVPFPGYNVTPNVLLLTGLLSAWALFRHQWLTIVPIARNLAIDDLSDAILVVDMGGHIVDFNRAAEQMLAISPRNTGQPVGQIIPQWEKLKGMAHAELEMENQGKQANFEVAINPVEDRRKQLIGLVITLHEFTERKELENRLLQLSEAVQQSPSSVAITDTHAVIQYINPKFTELTGYSIDEIRAQKMSLMQAAADDLPVYEEISEAIARGKIWRGEFLNQRKFGELYWEEMIISPVFDSQGKVINFIAVKEDITQRKKTDHELKKRIKELEVINAISVHISSQLDMESLISLIGQKLEEIFNAHSVFVALYDERTRLIDTPYWTINRKRVRVPSMELGQGLTSIVMQKDEPLLIGANFQQVSKKLGAVLPFIKKYGYPKTWLGVPVHIGEIVIGVLSVQDYEKEDAFDEDNVRLLQTIAANLGIAIQNARLYQTAQKDLLDRTRAEAKARHRAEQMSMLYNVSLTLTANLAFDQVLHELFERCRQILTMDSFYVAIYDEEQQMLSHPLFFDDGEFKQVPVRDIRTTPGLSGQVILSRKTLYLPDVMKQEGGKKYQIIHSGGKPARCYVGAPMVVSGRVIGVVSMQSYKANAYTREHIRLLETIATLAGVAIENSRLFERAQAEITQRRQANEDLQIQLHRVESLQHELREQATRDPLTGLHNRRFLNEMLEHRIHQAKRRNTPLCVLMIDIDLFKNFNDSYGHHAGDALLLALAGLLRSQTRSSDISCRYGGEEFLLVLSDTSLEIASRRAEQLRSSFTENEIRFGTQQLNATISIGIATFPEHGASVDELIIRADQALYSAKEAGRNRVAVWGE